MANQDEIRRLLKEGVEAAKQGDRESAKAALQQVTDLDSTNERAWYLLATLSTDIDEKRIYLENVLYINPDNERAQEMLNQLDSKAKESKRGKGKGKKEGGGGRRITRAHIYGALTVVLFLVLEITLFNVGSNRRQNATATVVAMNSVVSTNEALVQAQTATVVAQATGMQQTSEAAGTLTAMPTTTPTPTETYTPSPTPRFSPTPTLTPEPTSLYDPLPRDQFSEQIIVGWGGADIQNRGYVSIRAYQLDRESYIEVGDVDVNQVTINPANGQTLIYTRYFPSSFDFGLERANINGTQAQLVSDVWRGAGQLLLEQANAQFSLDGKSVVFTAVGENNTSEVWLFTIGGPYLPNQVPIIQLTDDNAGYSHPSVSPDGSQVVAVRIEQDSLSPEPDLVLIDVTTREQTPLTRDGFDLTELQSWFTPDGSAIIYAAAPNNEQAPADLIRLPLASGAPAIPVIRSPEVDERYPVISPDGKYVAYASNETGVYNIFIRELQTEQIYQITNEERDPVYPGGWYQPGVVERFEPVIPLPTPMVVEQPEEEEGEEG